MSVYHILPHRRSPLTTFRRVSCWNRPLCPRPPASRLPNNHQLSVMTSSQQDESIYLPPLIHYGSDSTSTSGSQLAGTNLTSSGELFGRNPHAYSGVYWSADIFVVDFPMGSLTSEYSNYDWSTGGPGTYDATPAACQPPCKSEMSQAEGALRHW